MKKLRAFLPLLFLGSIVMAQVADKAEDISPLLIGEKLPEAHLVNLDNEQVKLSELLKEKPTIIAIYRGGWCPFCTQQLSGLAEIQEEIADLGFQLIAISPDEVVDLARIKGKEKFDYQLLSDSNAEFIKNLGIAFKAPEMLEGFALSQGQKGKITKVLPVPTVLVVNKEGDILFEYISPNYRQRISPEMLLAVLKTVEKD
ncbi:peroxiredoxin family protein [Weeksellaceae bacterium TAE3-ERU29]|nr:peroxiredoxin family protein [Weeksellaceae bacterium TAE3-ERU29]